MMDLKTGVLEMSLALVGDCHQTGLRVTMLLGSDG